MTAHQDQDQDQVKTKEMAQQQNETQVGFNDDLYCKEDADADADGEQQEAQGDKSCDSSSSNSTSTMVSNSPFPDRHQYLLDDQQDMLIMGELEHEHDDELQTLLSKEEDAHFKLSTTYLKSDFSLKTARQEAVDWILTVKSYYAFSTLTAFLSVCYLHRFLDNFQSRRDRPNWMVQLAAVACLSLAAKVEETQVPLLFDFQVEKSKYVFEPKSIQRMELLVLSTLDWKMNLVTPISFLDYIIRRLPLVNHRYTEFAALFELILLSLITDPRFVHHRPSIVAAAVSFHLIDVMHIDQIDYYRSELYNILKLSKDELELEECYQFILQASTPTLKGGFNLNYLLSSLHP